MLPKATFRQLRIRRHRRRDRGAAGRRRRVGGENATRWPRPRRLDDTDERLAEACHQLAAAHAMPVTQPCEGCHGPRAAASEAVEAAIEDPEALVATCEIRVAMCEEIARAMEMLIQRLRIALTRIRVIPADFGEPTSRCTTSSGAAAVCHMLAVGSPARHPTITAAAVSLLAIGPAEDYALMPRARPVTHVRTGAGVTLQGCCLRAGCRAALHQCRDG